MKVLLLQDVRGIGKKYDIKEVSDGYARNFLIAKKIAVTITEKTKQIHKEFEERKEKLLKQRNKNINQLENATLKFNVKTGEKGEVFDPVTKEDIKKAIKQMVEFDGEVVLPQSLKTLGEHLVEINFGRGFRGQVKVVLKTA